MAKDELAWIEAAADAAAKLMSEGTTLDDARCPECGGASFVKISEIYFESSVRMYADPENIDLKREYGLSDREIVEKFSAPKRTSIMGVTAIVAVVLGAIAFLIYRRFGEDAGTFAGLGAAALLVGIALTTARKFSDRYYRRKAQWDRLYRCTKCGQVIRV